MTYSDQHLINTRNNLDNIQPYFNINKDYEKFDNDKKQSSIPSKTSIPSNQSIPSKPSKSDKSNINDFMKLIKKEIPKKNNIKKIKVDMIPYLYKQRKKRCNNLILANIRLESKLNHKHHKHHNNMCKYAICIIIIIIMILIYENYV